MFLEFLVLVSFFPYGIESKCATVEISEDQCSKEASNMAQDDETL